MKRLGKQGFSMIELLVVLLIIGILAAVAAPLFLTNSTKAKVSEAVAGAGEIRSAERTYYSQNSGYQAVSATQGSTYFGSAGTSNTVLGVVMHGNKYFSPQSYQVTTTGASWLTGTGAPSTTPVDFLVTVTGSSSVALSSGGNTDDGASAGGGATGPVGNIVVEMDDAGTTVYSTAGTGGPWNTF